MTIRTLLSFLLIGIFLLPASAQYGTVKGIVTIQNSGTYIGKVQYVDGATVVADSANPTITNDLGRFSLEYYKKAKSDPTEIQVKKRGLEVVNLDRLKTYIPSEDAPPLKIYMCRKGELAENILKFRGIATYEITKQYEFKLAHLERINEANAASILALEEERDQAINRFKDLAKKLATVNLDDELEVYRRAFRLFEIGKIEDADRVIQQAKLRNQVSEYKAQKVFLQERLHQNLEGIKNIANTYILQAQIRLAKLDIEGALAAYGEAIQSADTAIVEHNLEYADLLSAQNKLDKALPIYRKTLVLTQGNSTQQAYLHYITGAAYFGSNQITAAIKHFRSATRIYQDLIEEGQVHYRPFLAICQLMEGNAHGFNADAEAQEKSIRASINMFEVLAAADAETYEPYLAWSLVAGVSTMDSAIIEKGVNLSRKLMKKSPDLYSPLLGAALLNQLLYANQVTVKSSPTDVADFQKAVEKRVGEAFAIFEDQIGKLRGSRPKYSTLLSHPDSIASFEAVFNQSDVRANLLFSSIQVWAGMSTWLFSAPNPDSKLWELSSSILKVASDKCKQLMMQNEDRYAPLYLDFASMYGFILSMEGEYESAFNLLEESYKSALLLYVENNQTFELLLATNRIYYFLTQAYHYFVHSKFYGKTDRQELLTMVEELKVTLEKNKNLPFMNILAPMLEQWELCFKRTVFEEFVGFRLYQEYKNLSQFSLERNDYVGLVKQYFTGLKILEGLSKKYFSQEYYSYLLNDYQELIEGHFAEGRMDSVRYYQKKQLDLHERLALAFPSKDVRKKVGAICGNFSYALIVQKDFKGAIEFARRGGRIDPSQTWVYTNLALGSLLNDDWSTALRIYSEYVYQIYSQDTSVTFKKVFLNDLDSIEVAGLSHSNIKKARRYLEKPFRFSDEISEGLQLLEQGNKFYRKGQFEEAKAQFQKLIYRPYFVKFFWIDYYDILMKLVDCYKETGQAIRSKALLVYDQQLMKKMALEINENSWKAFQFASKKDYATLIRRMEAAYYLLEKSPVPWEDREAFEKAQAKFLGNRSAFHLFNGEYAKAIKLAQQALNFDPYNTKIAATLIEAYLFDDQWSKAAGMAKSWKSQTKKQMIYDLYLLEKNGKTHIRSQELLNLMTP